MTQNKRKTVRQVMRDDVTEVDGRINTLDAMRIMKRVDATCLIVKKRDEQDEYGLILFSDIAKQVIAKDRAPERVNAFEIMAKPVLSVHPNMSIRHCARLFERFGIGHAPVIEDKKAIGIVTYYLLVLGGLDLD